MKKNNLLFISAIIGIICIVRILWRFVYLLISMFYIGSLDGFSSLDALDGLNTFGADVSFGIGLVLLAVIPLILCIGAAVIFNWRAWALNVQKSALIAGILYTAFIIFSFSIFIAACAVLCFAAYFKMKQEYSD